MLYHENIEIEKIAFIMCSRKSVTCIAIMKLILCNFVLKKKAVMFCYSEHRQSALSLHVKHSLDGQIRR